MNKTAKRLFAVLAAVLLTFALGSPTSVSAKEETELIPGGMAFGVKFFTEGAIVLGTTGVETASGVVSPAKDAGLQSGDVIIHAGGEKFRSASEFSQLIAGCGGKPINIGFIREGNEQSINITPVKELRSGNYQIGVFVRDSTAGIGTVTYIDPETLDFGGLGHGIYDSETGVLLPLGRGAIVDVDINKVIKSEKNNPGQLQGIFGNIAEGELYENSEQGVFGSFNILPDGAGDAIPVASRNELKEGKATILTTLSGSDIQEFDIEIEEILDNSGTTKNFLIRVTDKELLSKTGGIVQGMSGSPIIQKGKLVGAVTHVIINDPIHGYGICIENMLNAADNAVSQQLYTPIAA